MRLLYSKLATFLSFYLGCCRITSTTQLLLQYQFNPRGHHYTTKLLRKNSQKERFRCLFVSNKKPNNAVKAQRLTVLIVLAANQNSEYSRALWHPSTVQRFWRQTNFKISQDLGAYFYVLFINLCQLGSFRQQGDNPRITKKVT